MFKVTVTFDLKKGFINWSGPTSKSSLRTIGPGIVELSLGQALVYRRTDRPTDRHVQSNIPLFFEGGIITQICCFITTPVIKHGSMFSIASILFFNPFKSVFRLFISDLNSFRTTDITFDICLFDSPKSFIVIWVSTYGWSPGLGLFWISPHNMTKTYNDIPF